MPIIVCECKVGIEAGVKAKIASEFTSAIREIILSPLDLISVVFHEATPDNTYRSGEPTSETLIFCHIRDGRSDGAVLSLSAIREIILSPLDLISVVFHEATPDNTYRSGEPTSETLIFCHIRDGRSDGAVLSLAKKVSSIWSACTGATEDEVEVLVTLYPAKYVVRGGERLPEAPRV
ncbi:hypothetical protein D8I24_0156 (plasmid) [Cupriavidus necator H850]|uniref:tautomerase family protein n=1 Tax=Cupriavidus necator TaxID=106590 RepID=UPI0020C17E61|nr:4-oxalocrotonate tautomerase [Cupriavidus necator]KAI3611167.1 hypothetical protein D8I24_0156 [Cupriavidus necator H850]